jgi:hypothetical protein
MAIPAIPPNFVVQTGNGQNYASWGITVGATTYIVQRSLDGVTYTTVATIAGSPLATSYLDTAVSIGTQYWYQVAAQNTSGTSAFTPSQTATPVPVGEMCLGQIRLASQQRADRVNSQFLTTEEWNFNINQSLFELYDILITQYGEDYFAAPAITFMTNGVSQVYPLPDGATTFTNWITGQPEIAPPFYKMLGVDLGLNAQMAQPNNGWVTINKFNFAADRNKFFYPNTASTIYGVFNLAYRIYGNQLMFIPAPSANQPVRLWYIPRMTQLLQDTDITDEGISGWIEYVIVDAAIKALQKEESDVSVLAAQKAALLTRINSASMNRDAGRPDTIADTRGTRGWGGWENGPGNGFGGGW